MCVCVCMFILSAGKKAKEQALKSEYRKTSWLCWWLLVVQVLHSIWEFILPYVTVVTHIDLKRLSKTKPPHPAKLCAKNFCRSIILRLNFESKMHKVTGFLTEKRGFATTRTILLHWGNSSKNKQLPALNHLFKLLGSPVCLVSPQEKRNLYC